MTSLQNVWDPQEIDQADRTYLHQVNGHGESRQEAGNVVQDDQRCTLLPVLFNFVLEAVMAVVLKNEMRGVILQ